MFFDNQIAQLAKLRASNPSEFWKALKKLRGKRQESSQPQVSLEGFHEHFKNLTFDKSAENELSRKSTETEGRGPLDFEFTKEEILSGIKELKSGKSHGCDFILNEFLKVSQAALAAIITTLFNTILATRTYPKDWAYGYIIPIFKKGEKTDPGNYRGITLLSHMGKLFTLLLNKRLTDYLTYNGILPEEQAGFRKGYRASDNLLVIKSLIEKYVNNKPKRNKNFLFTCFVDFSKAFDNISRVKLYEKLAAIGVTGNFLAVIQDMYRKDSACVKLNQSLSTKFPCNKGVKQGCMLSPTLFNIYLSDLPDILNRDKDVPVLNGEKRGCLLYADDLVLFSQTQHGLQNNVNELLRYGKINSLNINQSKTKALIFNRNGRKLIRYAFYSGRSIIENVTSYKYLGLVLSATGTFTVAKQELKKTALKALYALYRNMNGAFRKNVQLTIGLFDTLIKPILTYCCEIWGFDGKYNELRDPIEQVQTKCCKMLLGVSKRAVNSACRAELGRFPLIIEVKSRIISFWLRILTLPGNRLSKIAYMEMRPNEKPKSWALQLKMLLSQIGLGYVWEMQDSLCMADTLYLKSLQTKVKQRLEDIEIQNWHSSLFDDASRPRGKNKLRTFREFKTGYSLESYLSTIENQEHRRALTKLRISDHSLEIERGRYNKTYVSPEQRLCPCCKQMEDEKHFLIECKLYKEKRQTLFHKIKTQSFFSLINPKKNNAKIVAKYIYECLEIRKQI